MFVMSAEPMIVYFDGVCGFCNHTVDFLLRRDRRARLRFSPLQGETAKAQLASEDRAGLGSLIVSRGDRTFRRSAAVVRILWELPYPWPLLGWALWLVPLPLRDLGYRLFARFRYRLFGRLEACRLPQPGEAERFLP